MIDITAATQAMLECALWSSTDEDGDPLDGFFDISDIDEATRAELASELEAFILDSAIDLLETGMSADHIGHDFWLTRNGHGAGFWDRGLGEAGERLTAACKPWGSVDLYVTDEGRVSA